MAQIQICRGYGDKDWEELSKRLIKHGNEACWQRAIDIFERRMDERFFSCIRSLEAIDTPGYSPICDMDVNPDRELPRKEETSATPGFAIMALCCCLIETLQAFRVGNETESTWIGVLRKVGLDLPSHRTGKAFRRFLKECLGFKSKEAYRFVDGIRNGILHQTETRGWIIRKTQPEDAIVEKCDGLYMLNRTLFQRKLSEWFKDYVQKLRSAKDIDLRANFHIAMQRIAETCRN